MRHLTMLAAAFALCAATAPIIAAAKPPTIAAAVAAPDRTADNVKLDAGRFRDALIDDGSADLLDAVLCGILATWAWQRRDVRYGLPLFDALEGWIVGA